MIVVDASVAVKWVLPEPDSGPAVALREAGAMIVPSLVVAEIGNALWKSVLRGDVEKSDACAALQIAVAHFERLVSIDQLAARALELAVNLRHPIYDCLYLALAERERVPIVSADAKLLSAATQIETIEAKPLSSSTWIG
jgi:predicted nucleic acid-binding protein